MIYIITYNRSVNYGAFLQSYALKESIKKFADVEILNYQNKYIKECESLNFFKNKFIKRFIRFLFYNKKYRYIYKFINEISTDKIYVRENFLDADFSSDKIIVGSDQVWNYNCSGGDTTFLLDCFTDAKRYSYAASFGINKLPNNQIEMFKKNLSKFRMLSVREKTGKKICEEQLGLDATVVIDPTLLLTSEEWCNKLVISNKSKKYILVYTINNNKVIKETARKISRNYNLPIYNICNSVKDFWGDKRIKNAGAKEWVELFYNATFIVTDSFHGTAFAINFNKQFYVFAKNEKKSRIVDILETFGLSNRLFLSANDTKIEDKIDYDKVNMKLKDMRKESMAVLEEITND